ncbi:MAG: hypothetical protein ACRCYQ_07660, partial [Nocardioides sp.]
MTPQWRHCCGRRANLWGGRVPADGNGVGMGEMKVPQSMRPYVDQVVAVTDAVCQEHLDGE